MENVATYSEARSEYTKQLATFIVPSLVQWFQSLWARNAGDRQRCLSLFQSECEEVGRWNQDRIHDEVRVLIERSGCDYMEELMTAVFIAHTKVLTAVRLSTKQKKLSIVVPKLDHFIHRIFRESARTFWKSPFLFMDSGSVMERQKNILQIEALASDAITTAVRGLLPVKQILRDYMEDDQEEIEDEVVPAATAAPAEEHKEPEPEAVPVPAVAAAPTLSVSEISNSVVSPAVVNIDTEPAVQFSDYDDVYDEKKGAPEMRYTPKEGMGEGDDDDDDLAEMASDGILEVDENSAKPVGDDDAIDLEAPVPPKVVPPPHAPTPDKIAEDEVEVLE